RVRAAPPTRAPLAHSLFHSLIRRAPGSTLFPTRRSSDLRLFAAPGNSELDAFLFADGGRIRQRQDPWDDSANNRYDLAAAGLGLDRKSTRLNSSHVKISYAVFCLKNKKHGCAARQPTSLP